MKKKKNPTVTYSFLHSYLLISTSQALSFIAEGQVYDFIYFLIGQHHFVLFLIIFLLFWVSLRVRMASS